MHGDEAQVPGMPASIQHAWEMAKKLYFNFSQLMTAQDKIISFEDKVVPVETLCASPAILFIFHIGTALEAQVSAGRDCLDAATMISSVLISVHARLLLRIRGRTVVRIDTSGSRLQLAVGPAKCNMLAFCIVFVKGRCGQLFDQ